MPKQTTTAPTVPLKNFKRTKMIATVGPATNDYESILAMLKAGVNGFRLNFSHGSYEERDQQIAWIRQASEECGKPCAIIQDLQGPKIRLGDFEGIVEVKKGHEYMFAYGADYEKTGRIPVQYDLSAKVKRGETILLADGRVRMTCSSVRPKEHMILARAENDGILLRRKGINLPDTDFEGDIITKKDKADIVYGAHQDIDYVAMSFVQSADDVKQIKRLLKAQNSRAKVISKIETRAATENLEEIIRESDAVMVARGDLAMEVSPEAVPIIQRQIIGLCLEYGKISIVATQMLATMTTEPEPTRAEVSDVATAVIVGADCVMLSDETANGKYPVETVKIMKRIILFTQENSPLKPLFYKEDTSVASAITSAVITLAEQVKARAIVAETSTGATALSIAAHRPSMPIIIVTGTSRVAQQMAIVYGSKSYVRPETRRAGQKLTDWLREQRVFAKGDTIVSASGQYPGVAGGTDTVKVRVLD